MIVRFLFRLGYMQDTKGELLSKATSAGGRTYVYGKIPGFLIWRLNVKLIHWKPFLHEWQFGDFLNGVSMNRLFNKIKIGLGAILSIMYVSCMAQHSTLEAFNPIPRQGQEIELKFSIDNKDVTAIENKQNKSKVDLEYLSANNIGKGTFKISQVLNDTGKVTIGPFSFTIDGRIYQTNALTIHVFPKLPDNITDGIWIRSTDFEGKSYLIVEQRVPNNPGKKSNAQESVIAIGNEDVNFAELNEDKLAAAGLKVVSSSSSSSIQKVESSGKDLFAGSVNYKQSTYTIERLPAFKGPLKIDKKFFYNSSSQVYTPDVVVR
jgi:hypothetical protein